MKKLKDQLHNKKDVNVIGLDSVLLFSDQFRKNIDSEAIVADAGLMPIQESSLSAVNASAVFHEISSYGVNTENDKKIFGIKAVEKTLNEITRCLVDEGVLIYRDVACPKDRLKIKTVEYDRKSWQLFIDMYLPVLMDASKGILPEILNGCKIKTKEGKTCITATAQVQREIQRHYITFRDYFRKKIFPDIGVNIINETWNEKSEGNKAHSIELSSVALSQYIDKIKPDNPTCKMNNLFLTLPSDDYDDFTDELIALTLNDKNSDLLREWLRREGREIYTYLEPTEIKNIVSSNQSIADAKESLLSVDSEKMIPRYYYQRYLDRIIKNPEFEGKQIINFIKKTYET